MAKQVKLNKDGTPTGSKLTRLGWAAGHNARNLREQAARAAKEIKAKGRKG